MQMEWWKEQQLSTQSICNQDNRIRMNLGLCKDIMYTSLDWNQSINSSVSVYFITNLKKIT